MCVVGHHPSRNNSTKPWSIQYAYSCCRCHCCHHCQNTGHGCSTAASRTGQYYNFILGCVGFAQVRFVATFMLSTVFVYMPSEDIIRGCLLICLKVFWEWMTSIFVVANWICFSCISDQNNYRFQNWFLSWVVLEWRVPWCSFLGGQHLLHGSQEVLWIEEPGSFYCKLFLHTNMLDIALFDDDVCSFVPNILHWIDPKVEIPL